MYNETTPMAKHGEFFLVQRSHMSFSGACEGLPVLKCGSGSVYLTTTRIVFVCEPAVRLRDGSTFRAFELPLAKLRDAKFQQPIFGANYIGGVLAPSEGGALDVDTRFKIAFAQGGGVAGWVRSMRE